MIVSLTHEHDLDGLGSQAIILRYYRVKREIKKEEIKLFYAHYLDFKEKIKTILDKKDLPDELIISDIGFNDDFVNLFNLFERAKSKGCKISWFDHHIVDEKIKKEISKFCKIYINDPKRCAAEIVKDYFLPSDPIAIKISQYARDTDFKTKKYPIATDLQLIIGFNRGDDKIKEKIQIVQLLSEGDFENEWFRKQLEALKEWNEKESRLAIERAKIIDLDDDEKFAISHARIGGGRITELLKEHYPGLLAYIGVDERYNESIIFSNKINCREFARLFNGGGHVERAGFWHENIFNSDKKFTTEFIKDVKKTLLQFVKKE